MANYQLIKALNEYLGDYNVLNSWFNSDKTHANTTLEIIVGKLRALRRKLKGLKKQITKDVKEKYDNLTNSVKTLIEKIEAELYTTISASV